MPENQMNLGSAYATDWKGTPTEKALARRTVAGSHYVAEIPETARVDVARELLHALGLLLPEPALA